MNISVSCSLSRVKNRINLWNGTFFALYIMVGIFVNSFFSPCIGLCRNKTDIRPNGLLDICVVKSPNKGRSPSRTDRVKPLIIGTHENDKWPIKTSKTYPTWSPSPLQAYPLPVRLKPGPVSSPSATQSSGGQPKTYYGSFYSSCWSSGGLFLAICRSLIFRWGFRKRRPMT